MNNNYLKSYQSPNIVIVPTVSFEKPKAEDVQLAKPQTSSEPSVKTKPVDKPVDKTGVIHKELKLNSWASNYLQSIGQFKPKLNLSLNKMHRQESKEKNGTKEIINPSGDVSKMNTSPNLFEKTTTNNIASNGRSQVIINKTQGMSNKNQDNSSKSQVIASQSQDIVSQRQSFPSQNQAVPKSQLSSIDQNRQTQNKTKFSDSKNKEIVSPQQTGTDKISTNTKDCLKLGDNKDNTKPFIKINLSPKSQLKIVKNTQIKESDKKLDSSSKRIDSKYKTNKSRMSSVDFFTSSNVDKKSTKPQINEKSKTKDLNSRQILDKKSKNQPKTHEKYESKETNRKTVTKKSSEMKYNNAKKAEKRKRSETPSNNGSSYNMQSKRPRKDSFDTPKKDKNIKIQRVSPMKKTDQTTDKHNTSPNKYRNDSLHKFRNDISHKYINDRPHTYKNDTNEYKNEPFDLRSKLSRINSKHFKNDLCEQKRDNLIVSINQDTQNGTDSNTKCHIKSPVKKVGVQKKSKKKKYKTIQFTIKVLCREEDSDGSDESDEESEVPVSNNDLSFLDDFNVDEIVDSLQTTRDGVSNKSTNADCKKVSKPKRNINVTVIPDLEAKNHSFEDFDQTEDSLVKNSMDVDRSGSTDILEVDPNNASVATFYLDEDTMEIASTGDAQYDTTQSPNLVHPFNIFQNSEPKEMEVLKVKTEPKEGETRVELHIKDVHTNSLAQTFIHTNNKQNQNLIDIQHNTQPENGNITIKNEPIEEETQSFEKCVSNSLGHIILNTSNIQHSENQIIIDQNRSENTDISIKNEPIEEVTQSPPHTEVSNNCIDFPPVEATNSEVHNTVVEASTQSEIINPSNIKNEPVEVTQEPLQLKQGVATYSIEHSSVPNIQEPISPDTNIVPQKIEEQSNNVNTNTIRSKIDEVIIDMEPSTGISMNKVINSQKEIETPQLSNIKVEVMEDNVLTSISQNTAMKNVAESSNYDSFANTCMELAGVDQNMEKDSNEQATDIPIAINNVTPYNQVTEPVDNVPTSNRKKTLNDELSNVSTSISQNTAMKNVTESSNYDSSADICMELTGVDQNIEKHSNEQATDIPKPINSVTPINQVTEPVDDVPTSTRKNTLNDELNNVSTSISQNTAMKNVTESSNYDSSGDICMELTGVDQNIKKDSNEQATDIPKPINSVTPINQVTELVDDVPTRKNTPAEVNTNEKCEQPNKHLLVPDVKANHVNPMPVQEVILDGKLIPLPDTEIGQVMENKNNKSLKSVNNIKQNCDGTGETNNKKTVKIKSIVKGDSAKPDLPKKPEPTLEEIVVPKKLLINEDIQIVELIEARMQEYLHQKYTITSLIHFGRFSKIYKCLDLSGRKFVVKYILKESDRMQLGSQKEAMLKEMQRDIPKHNCHTVWLFTGFGIQRKWGHLMEYFPKTLREELVARKQPFNLDEIQGLARQLVSAVLTLRNNNIVHTDIKPSHILLSHNCQVLKLGGFDSCSKVNEIEVRPNLGTLFYRAPEIIVGFTIGYKVDVWSTAAVLYEMFTKYKLFYNFSNNCVLFHQMCLFGNLPHDMINSSLYGNMHFVRNAFVHKKCKNKLVPKFFKNGKFYTHLSHAYFKYYGHNHGYEGTNDLKKLLAFHNLLQSMLILDPRRRMPIEFACADPFIHH